MTNNNEALEGGFITITVQNKKEIGVVDSYNANLPRSEADAIKINLY